MIRYVARHGNAGRLVNPSGYGYVVTGLIRPDDTAESITMTPDEARLFALKLIKAADQAEAGE